MEMKSSAGDLLTLDQTASRLLINRKTLLNWRSRGYGPTGFRLGRAVVFEREAVDRWIAAQRSADPVSSRTEARTG